MNSLPYIWHPIVKGVMIFSQVFGGHRKTLRFDPQTLQLRLYYRQMLKCVTKENENVDVGNLPEGWNLCKKTHQLPQSSPTSGRNVICQKC